MQDREQEFREAFERHSDELFRHASFRLSSRDRALEVTQECFLKAWEYMQQGNLIREYRSFLYRTLHNLIIDEYRKKKSVSLEAMFEASESSVALEGKLLRDELDIEERAAVQYEARQVLSMLGELPELYRSVIVLRYIDGLSPSEIADMTGESENAVSVRLHRGVRKLRELLASSPTQDL